MRDSREKNEIVLDEGWHETFEKWEKEALEEARKLLKEEENNK